MALQRNSAGNYGDLGAMPSYPGKAGIGVAWGGLGSQEAFVQTAILGWFFHFQVILFPLPQWGRDPCFPLLLPISGRRPQIGSVPFQRECNFCQSQFASMARKERAPQPLLGVLGFWAHSARRCVPFFNKSLPFVQKYSGNDLLKHLPVSVSARQCKVFPNQYCLLSRPLETAEERLRNEQGLLVSICIC